MQIQPPRRKSSAGPLFVIVLLFGFLFLGVLVVAGAGVFFLANTRVSHARALAERELARHQVERVRATAERVRATAEQNLSRAQTELERATAHNRPEVEPDAAPVPAAPEPIVVASREITVKLDQEGNIEADGKSLDLEQLKAMLQDASKGRETALGVTVKADKQCLFEHVASVLNLCKEAKVSTVRIATVDP